MLTELVKQYEVLWETDAPMEQIVDFCRRHLQMAKINPKGHEESELLSILKQSNRWGPMICMPMFLMHLKDDDDELLKLLGEFYRDQDKGGKLWWQCMCAARILAMKTLLSEKVRAFFWCLMMRNISWCHSGVIYESCADINLVDNIDILNAIIYYKSSGYERISPGLYFNYGRGGKYSAKMLEAIRFDSASLFEMELTLSGKKITAAMLRELFYMRAFNLIEHLLRKRRKSLGVVLSPQDLLIWLCSLRRNLGSLEGKLKLIDTLEELYPGICKCVDKLGNTPLWYYLRACIYSGKLTNEIVQSLVRYGCDPDQQNHLGLSYRICKEMMQKTSYI
jgi:hypothetical protein